MRLRLVDYGVAWKSSVAKLKWLVHMPHCQPQIKDPAPGSILGPASLGDPEIL